jgi:predicted transcriptional regulator
MMITARQIRMARVALDWEQKDLAGRCGLSIPTIQRMEKLGLERSAMGNVQKMRKAFEDAGIEFINEADREGVCVRQS